MAIKSTTSVEPPKETSGSVSPLVGSAPKTTPTLMVACKPNMVVSPAAK